MSDEFHKMRKKIKKEFETEFEVDDDSELPVHEKLTKQKKVRNIDDDEEDDDENRQEEE
ncbi:MAG: hypothetical protein KJ574_05030 [Nanoarchaeota archaeon]|nr:hypothetical protein [Nanoarchaeota archaeon]